MLEKLKEALEGAGFVWAHFGWSKNPEGDFGVYAEDSGEDFQADGEHAEKGTNVYVHLFTREDSGAPQRAVEAALNGLRMPWYLNTVQFEPDTGYIHYEWEVGLLGNL